jgi:UDP-2,3-diacylglucosamine pyrophosphatase LpxH
MTRSFRLPLAALICALGLLGCAHRASAPSNEVRFVVLGDSQFGSPALFQRMIHEVEMLHPDLVIQVGDLIHGYTHDPVQIHSEWERYLREIAPLTAPFYPVPGNHDTVTPETFEIYGEVWRGRVPGGNPYVYSFDEGPAHFVVLDTYWPEESDMVGPWQREWLANDLADFAARHGGEGSARLEEHPIFVFLHSPLWRYSGAPEATEESRESRRVWDEEIHPLLLRYPVRMVVAGHTHEYVWENRDGIDYVVIVSTGSTSRARERTGIYVQFLHIDVAGGEVHPAVICAGSVLPIDTVDSAERGLHTPVSIGSETIRIPNPVGGDVDEEITVRLSNTLLHDRIYEMEWEGVHGTLFSFEPPYLEATVAGQATEEFTFRVQVPESEAPEDLPHLHISALEPMRTGVVPRDWEARYRAEIAAAETDPTIPTTSIALDASFEITANWSLFIPPAARASRLEGEIAIDGLVDEEAWQAAEPLADFIHCVGDEEVPTETALEVRFLYDDEYLYVSAWMEEPNPVGLRTDAEPPIPLTWSDDDFELFLDAGITQRRYMRFFQNSAGTRFTRQNSSRGSERGEVYWGDYESGVHVGDDFWSLEYKIAWDEISGTEPAVPGEQWGLNIWQHRQQSEQTRSWWRGAGGGYAPGRYGVLVFE